MKISDLLEDGRIVKGVNTTPDVGPNEITKQAKKFGNTVDKDGRPPTLSKKVKGKSTNVLFNLGLTEGRNKNEAQELSSVSTIYVDMDGVLADFFGAWAKLMKKDHWTKIDDIMPALQKIRDTENFWLDLPLTANAKNLLMLIKDVKGEYNILSSPLPDDPNSEPHKREWIKKNLNFFPPKDIIITHDKAKYATTEDGTPNILIDDYGVNIQKWEAAGGVGFKHKDHKFERTAKNIKQHMQEPVTEDEKDDFSQLINPMGQDSISLEKIKQSPGFHDLITTMFASGTQADLEQDEILYYISKLLNINTVEIKAILQKDGFDFTEPDAAERFKQNMDATGGIHFGKTKTRTLNSKYSESYSREQLPQIHKKNLKNIRHTMEWVRVEDLIPVQEERILENFKRQVDRIVAGKYNPIVVDCDNKIVNGHHRYEAAKLMGYDEMAVAKLPFTVKQIVENFANGMKK
jgi:5'(3')-deoxyribonucleotidase